MRQAEARRYVMAKSRSLTPLAEGASGFGMTTDGICGPSRVGRLGHIELSWAGILPRSLRYAGRARKNRAQEKAACSGRDDSVSGGTLYVGPKGPTP